MNRKNILLLICLLTFSFIMGCSTKPSFIFSNELFIDTYQAVSKANLPDNIIVNDDSITLNDGSIDEAVYILTTLEKTLNNNEFAELADDLLSAQGIYSNELVASNIYVGISAENESNIRLNILPDEKSD